MNRVAIGLFLALVMISSVASAAVQDGMANDYAHQGYRLAKNHQTLKAIQYFTAAIHADPSGPNAYVYRAQAYLELKQWGNSLDDCNSALRVKPGEIRAYMTRAVAQYYLGRDAASLSDVTTVLKARPTAETAKTVMEVRESIYLHPLQESSESVRIALELANGRVKSAKGNKARAEALNSRAWLFATSPIAVLRNGDQAVRDATEACSLTSWREGYVVDTLAAASAEKSDFTAAIRVEQQALSLSRGKPDLIQEYKRRLSEYESHRPLRIVSRDDEPPIIDRN